MHEPPNLGLWEDDDATDQHDDAGGIQLGLFTPERAEAEAGFAALARLDLQRAEELFEGMLRRAPQDEEGRTGLAAVAHWRGVLGTADPLPPLARAEAIWNAVAEAAPGLVPRTLRRRLLEEVLETLEMQAAVLPIADLCVADVLVALGRTGSARLWLRQATHAEPGRARLQLLLGDALHDVSESEARISYSQGLLVDPTLERWNTVAWRELARRVREIGGPAAALEMWAAGRLPLPPPDVAVEPHPTLEAVWRTLALAESDRRRGRHDDMIRHRLHLRDLAPDVFSIYMERLEGG